MTRSIAASMASSRSDKRGGFEFGDRPVGEPDLVGFAAVKHVDDNFEQPVVGDEIVRDGAGAAKVVRGDGVGLANHPHVQEPNTALDQHGPILRFAGISPRPGTSSNLGGKISQLRKAKAHRPEKPADAPWGKL